MPQFPSFSRRQLKKAATLDSPRHRLLTTAEAAEAAGVTAACIRQWAHRGYLAPVARRGKHNLYLEDHVLRVEHSRRVRLNSSETSDMSARLSK
ncbi:MerR family transcriptional regulator [Streptomyces olivoreticuli]|uniref:MerR family transcriptional regulator n=1 Tax=Streptomyces olivoreticuli TaxID=68246 RepID=UPI000E2729D2|nr:helix-turn-helix domain-containing protein [Streptomyces olivoreticuli]